MSVNTKLWDTVDILDEDDASVLHADLPAHVDIADSETPAETGWPNRLWRPCGSSCPAVEIDRLSMLLRWRDEPYHFDSDAMLRRVRGQDHHQTFNLVRTEG